ncbi:MAG: hypothetical protein HY302_00140 [Opitutae bacterium]|nr:hypothetical protein [Opitutae bacterium]
MTANTQQITEAALKLPERDRLRVATAIWRSFGASDDALADLAALSRSHELETGQVQPKTQGEVFKNARAAL